MKTSFNSFIIVCLILVSVSCSKKENFELLTISVDIDQDVSLPLSEIAEEIRAVELELTDESLISHIRRILICDNYIIVLNGRTGGQTTILLFDNRGKFVRQIGSVGLGPNEYIFLSDIAVDVQKKRLFLVTATNKLICCNLEGNFIKEYQSDDYSAIYINYINNELMLIAEHFGNQDHKGLFISNILYKIDDDLQIRDSIDIYKVYLERGLMMNSPWRDYISNNAKDAYFYYAEIFPNKFLSEPQVLRDTLYRIEKNQFIPDLKLKFKDNGIAANGNKFIHLYNIYRSSRFIFSVYENDRRNGENYRFCYDTKTGKAYNMKDGYTDDIYHTPEKIKIRHLNSDANKFYYLYTNMDNAVDLEEPNPTLYIGTLKK
jgi:hypothetical protein